MSRLYHFTSFDSACKIIKSGKLRFSKAWRLNDLIESNRVVGERTISERLLVNRPYLLNAEAEMRKYQSEATVRSYQKMKADAEAGNPNAIRRYETYLAKRREEYRKRKAEKEEISA